MQWIADAVAGLFSAAKPSLADDTPAAKRRRTATTPQTEFAASCGAEIQTSCSTPAADAAAGISARHTTAHENGSDISGGAFSSDDGALAGTLVCMFLALSDDPGRPLPCLKGCKGHRCGKGQGHTCTTNVALTDAASAAVLTHHI